MHANAASIAACNWHAGRRSATPTSTSVPSNGRARRTQSGRGAARPRSAAGEGDGVGCKNSPDTIGDVLAGHGCAADVLDIAADAQRVAMLTARELGAPVGVAHLAAIGLAILHYLGLA